MRFILLKFFTIILTFFCLIGKSEATEKLPESFQILPQPQSIELLPGTGLFYNKLKNLKIIGKFKRPVVGDLLDILTELEGTNSGTLSLKLSNSEALPESNEGYILIITDGNVKIEARGKAGLFYGCQTLEQLLEDSREYNIAIPACKIIDYPDYSYRAVHFDTKHHLDHIKYYYDSIDRLARYKINAIVWEFEDKLRYQRQPLVGAPQAISIEEMAALTRYARERNIEITPLVQGLGHATYILKHPEYSDLQEIENNRWAFCPMDERTYEVLFDLYRDAIKATPGSKYFHIGGDEVSNIGFCDRCKSIADKKGKFELNLYWLNRVSEFIVKQGRIPIYWDDMVFKYGGVWYATREENDSPNLWKEAYKKLDKVIKRFPKDGVLMHWNYSTCKQPGNIRTLDWLVDKKMNAMIATAVQSGKAALFPADDRTGKMSDRGVTAIQSSIQIAYKKGITGELTTAWDDRSPHMETYWKGYIASAEYSWNAEGRNLTEYQTAYMQREFGIYANYSDLYLNLRSAALFWETSLVRKGNRLDRENTLFELPILNSWIPKEKRKKNKHKNNFNDIVIELPDLKHPGNFSKKYKTRLEEAERQCNIYKSTSYKLIELHKISIRNRYHWEIYSALNDFQINAPQLLLSLKQCDVKDVLKRKEGYASVKKTLRDFDNAWSKLKEVYAKTRFITYPDNYVKDRYFHFASQREDLTWMIQVEELLHQKICEWIKSDIVK